MHKYSLDDPCHAICVAIGYIDAVDLQNRVSAPKPHSLSIRARLQASDAHGSRPADCEAVAAITPFYDELWREYVKSVENYVYLS